MGIKEVVQNVAFAARLNEALWEVAFEEAEITAPRTLPTFPYYRLTTTDILRQKLGPEDNANLETALQQLEDNKLCFRMRGEVVQLYLPGAFDVLRVAKVLAGETINEAELRYFYMSSIRRRFNLCLNSSTAEKFGLLAHAASQVIERTRRSSKRDHRRGTIIDIDELRAARKNNLLNNVTRSELKAFVEACRVVKYLQLDHRPRKVRVNSKRIGSEFLLSNIFGLATTIPGFDDLFGGGGIMLTDDVGGYESSSGEDPVSVDGRKVLVVGRYGSGKSLLSLEVAVEVAKKGGVAWVMPLEQPVAECLYSLAAVGRYPDRKFVRIETNPVHAAVALRDVNDDRGLLIFVDDIKESYELFLQSLQENGQLLAKHRAKFPLRLIVVDPINAVFRKRDLAVAQLRGDTLRALDDVARANTNVWIVTEDKSDRELTFSFEQNIADTVIKLHNTRSHDYSLRFIEICKSRMQREQRGWHPISIKPENGISVVLAPAAVAARIKPRSVQHTGQYVKFGVPGMDEILGPKAVTTGDVIIITGPEGSMKTQIGYAFLLNSDLPPERKGKTRARSLLVSVGEDPDRLGDALEQTVKGLHSAAVTKSVDEVVILAIPKGYIQPGVVLQLIEQSLLQARRDDFVIDRVLVDDVRSWVLSCPFLSEDDTFGDTLVELFRKYGVTSCYICSDVVTGSESALQDMIVSNADCSIRLTPHNIKGVLKSIVRVTKTREMTHRRELFELSATETGPTIEPISSLLRVDNEGVIRPVTIRLFMHAETLGQEVYNNHLTDVVKSTISPETHLEDQSKVFLSASTSLGGSTAIDELHLVQLDEYQMPSPSDKSTGSIQLWRFDDTQWQENWWGGQLPKLNARVKQNNTFVGLPLFTNIGLLAYQKSLSSEVVSSWKQLAAQCAEWEKDNKPPALFFDFPGGTDENYNCFFWELLLAEKDVQVTNVTSDCALIKILTGESAIKAALIMRTLARRAHLQKGFHRNQDSTSRLREHMSTSPTALVWRHWYTTLNDMLVHFGEEERRNIRVTFLPGGVCIAGEWFVAVPQYSAAPEKGLDLIKMLTSREAELDRMVRGVGLPTRTDFFYGDNGNSQESIISPFFRLKKREIGDRISNAFRRSQFACYSLLSPVLAIHLKQILEISGDSVTSLEDEAECILNSLGETLQFVRATETNTKCASCRHNFG
jgi:KaiC/GvpD/RAD55 family RecA-like ATPase